MAGGKKPKAKKESASGAHGKDGMVESAPADSRDNTKATEFVYIEPEKPATETDKKIRSLRKKVREIIGVKEKIEATQCQVTPEMAARVESLPAVERQIAQLLLLAAFEAAEAARIAAAKAVEDVASEKAAAIEASKKAEVERIAAEKEACRKAAAEVALAKQRREALEVLVNIQPNGKEAKENARTQALLEQTAGLCEDVFHDNCLKGGENAISKKGGWKLCLLARPPPEDAVNAPLEEPTELLGFLVYRLRPEQQCLSIAKIAVPEKHRGRGFGKYLMDWATEYAKKQASLQFLSLSSLPEAVQFYQRFGFRPVEVSTLAGRDDELIEGQVYMEYRLKGQRKSLTSKS